MKAFSPRWLMTVLLPLLLAGGAALAQDNTPAPGPHINRNPVFRDNLPPAPPVEPDPRDTVVPSPGPGDPRDSDTRPVLPPDSRDGRDAAVPMPGATPVPGPGPTVPRPEIRP